MASSAFRHRRISLFWSSWPRPQRPRALGAAVVYFRNTFSSPNGINTPLPPAAAAQSGQSSKMSSTSLHPLPLIKNHIKEKLANELPMARKKHGRFISPWPKTYKNMTDIIQLAISNFNSNWNELPQEMNTLPAVAVDKDLMKTTDHPHVTWIGHSTCYVQLNGKYFITDPIWSARAFMVQWIGPKRFRPPPIKLDELHIDYVLISHDHYDHFDAQTAKKIGNRAQWIVPKGLKKTLRGLGVTNVIELSWWESHTITTKKGETSQVGDSNSDPHASTNDSAENTPLPNSTAIPDRLSTEGPQDVKEGDMEIVFTPTQHWSCRGLFDRCTVLWGSFCVLSREKKFFFAGDTAYCSVFKQIGEIYGPFDLAILPIGAYKPRWFLKDYHVDPSEALQLHYDLKAKQSVAVHWGTFKLSEERCVEPALELGRVRELAGETAGTFSTMAHGETVKFGDRPRFDYVSLYPQFLKEHIDKNDY